jgi:hypothetical protein
MDGRAFPRVRLYVFLLWPNLRLFFQPSHSNPARGVIPTEPALWATRNLSWMYNPRQIPSAATYLSAGRRPRNCTLSSFALSSVLGGAIGHGDHAAFLQRECVAAPLDSVDGKAREPYEKREQIADGQEPESPP